MTEEKLNELELRDLTEYYRANHILLEYFANQAQMHRNYCGESEEKTFQEAYQKQVRCSGLETRIIREIEKRLFDEI